MAILIRILTILGAVIFVLVFSTLGALIVLLAEDKKYEKRDEQSDTGLQTDESGDQSNKPLLGRGNEKRKGR